MSPVPAPEDMRQFYVGGYQKMPASLSALRAIARREAYRLKPLLEHKRSGKLLEIGPWIGIFSSNAKDAGFDVTALEIDQNCVEFLNDVVGIRAIQSSYPAETLGRMDDTFDVIAIWHALEHLPDPWLVVQKAAERLNPGGVLLIAIPNIESYAFATLKERWLHLDAPRHLYFYRTEALVKLCESYGLVKLQTVTSDELSEELSRNTWHSWGVRKARIKYARGVLGRLRFYSLRKRIREEEKFGCGLTAVFQRT
jgi:2-polyprenyl-3-methyl-5-hydroxy-6-metoxy-1,4-benzoquinol methylase